MPRPTHALINLAALRHNFDVAQRCAPRSKVIAVIKADAYGHGIWRAVKALKDAHGLAVVLPDEAIALRQSGYPGLILLLEGFFSASDIAALAQHQITLVIHSPQQLHLLLQAVLPNRINIFIKLNTGMNRLGFALSEFPSAMRQLQHCPNVDQITLMTHYATADEEQGITEQLKRFELATQSLTLPCSTANSAALLCFPESHKDWVRPGIMLYGASPVNARTAPSFDLRPVMTLKSAVIAIQNLQAGERLGYGGIYEAPTAMRVGVVACGYADGYPRHAGTGTPVLVDGLRTQTLGRVSMDMLCIDLSNYPNAGINSEVILWGDNLPVEEVAQAAGTISYELLCQVTQRVPRVEINH